MIHLLFIVIIGFIVIMQTSIPYLLKRTIAFGVSIPEGHTDDPSIASYKKIYAIVSSIVGIAGLIAYVSWMSGRSLSGEKVVLAGLFIQFSILFVSMALYLYFHAKVIQLKRAKQWGANLKQVRIVDLEARAKDEMLPSYLYIIPMLITIGLMIYTGTQYHLMPERIPTHWGPNGQPDAFTEKTPFSVIATLLIALIIQAMMLMINVFTKKSGIRIRATKRQTSQIQQLSFRKYTSWFLFLTTVLITTLFGFLQVTTIHAELENAMLMMAAPLVFLVIILLATAAYAFKVGQSGSRIEVQVEDDAITGITDFDDDRFWKFGVFYMNKNDPSIFVEKRFGIGWTINFGNPIGYLILFVPILLILAISFLV
ncbi:DUF1648 domain-containing protein [Sporosarcina sp. HYO08]|uniref:DUF1648 domain-containing protein n=1 Tax=Sporosarcina sp. HYO08 TaxID=1759557 RepID=UPI000796C687|nr:DUF5808 domain-containing protein [Sporosarcina sp. HYO08]KXH87225.1 hypothetical protein AU377_01230 [Sporosarcina sp. HYO08]